MFHRLFHRRTQIFGIIEGCKTISLHIGGYYGLLQYRPQLSSAASAQIENGGNASIIQKMDLLPGRDRRCRAQGIRVKATNSFLFSNDGGNDEFIILTNDKRVPAYLVMRTGTPGIELEFILVKATEKYAKTRARVIRVILLPIIEYSQVSVVLNVENSRTNLKRLIVLQCFIKTCGKIHLPRDFWTFKDKSIEK